MARPGRMADCHPDKKNYGGGLCNACYKRAYYHTPQQRKKREEYLARPEVQARIRAARRTGTTAAYNRVYRARPEARARAFAKNWGVDEKSVLPWMKLYEPKCWICGEEGARDLDHDHKTGEIRGWAHAQCNMAMGVAERATDPRRLLLTIMETVVHG